MVGALLIAVRHQCDCELQLGALAPSNLKELKALLSSCSCQQGCGVWQIANRVTPGMQGPCCRPPLTESLPD